MKNRAATATVTFAVYDETPIACQGDDDQKRIMTIQKRMAAGADLHADALELSVDLARRHDTFVQLWDIQMDGEQQ